MLMLCISKNVTLGAPPVITFSASSPTSVRAHACHHDQMTKHSTGNTMGSAGSGCDAALQLNQFHITAASSSTTTVDAVATCSHWCLAVTAGNFVSSHPRQQYKHAAQHASIQTISTPFMKNVWSWRSQPAPLQPLSHTHDPSPTASMEPETLLPAHCVCWQVPCSPQAGSHVRHCRQRASCVWLAGQLLSATPSVASSPDSAEVAGPTGGFSGSTQRMLSDSQRSVAGRQPSLLLLFAPIPLAVPVPTPLISFASRSLIS